MPLHYFKGVGVGDGFVAAHVPDNIFQSEEFKKSPSQFYVGFLSPDKIETYYCEKCGHTADEAPKIKVVIGLMGSDKPSTTVGYYCGNCGKNIIFNYLESPEGIPPEFIEFDETGDYKTPTIKDIEERLKQALSDAQEGTGGSLEAGSYKTFLEQAIHWAGKISYEIPEKRIEELETTYRDAYLRNAQEDLDATVQRIKQVAYGFSSSSMDDEISAFKGTGLCDLLEYLYEVLPHIEIPDDPEVKDDILRILKAHRGMHESDIEELRQDISSINEQIVRESENIKGINERISSYLEKTGMNKEDAQSVGSLSTFPGDYNDD